MRSTIRLLYVAVAAVLLGVLGDQAAHAAPPPLVEPIIWQLNRDYPEGSPADSSLAISTVYIKTHDGSDWMSTYDQHPYAVSGPASIQNLINIYGAQRIEVAAWFVPKGNDYDRQVEMAVQVIDSGVTALYADLEPFSGFCNRDCAVLAANFWTRVRAERPNARLGVIYDPRPQYWNPSATPQWFANADVALPMCYWETFAGQGIFGDPAGCITQARADLAILSPNRPIEYLPILQGDSTAERTQIALDAAIRSGASRVSLWRRGVVPNEVWNMIRDYQAPSGPHCALNLVENCVIKDASSGTVYIMRGGARFGFPSWDSFIAMGFSGRDIQVLPSGVIPGVPIVPVDGTAIREFGGETTYVVLGGAKFAISGDAPAGGGDGALIVPPGGAGQVPSVPRDFTRLRETGSEEKFVIINGGLVQLDESGHLALAEMGFPEETVHVVPDGALRQVPVLQVKKGDVDCDGAIGIADVLRVVSRVNGLVSSSPCLGFAGDVTCDGRALMDDAMLILLHFAELPAVGVAGGCPSIGEPVPAVRSSGGASPDSAP
jgi:hypothetical protein